MNRIGTVLKNLTYNFILHTTPKPEQNSLHYHWHLEIIPKKTYTGGFEFGTGVYINPLKPENAAQNIQNDSLKPL